MAIFDEDDLKDVADCVKSDLTQIDATIEKLIKEAQNRNGQVNLVYHDLANPLSRLISTKQKSVDQLLKIIDKYVNPAQEQETELDLDDLYSNFEPVEKEKIK